MTVYFRMAIPIKINREDTYGQIYIAREYTVQAPVSTIQSLKNLRFATRSTLLSHKCERGENWTTTSYFTLLNHRDDS